MAGNQISVGKGAEASEMEHLARAAVEQRRGHPFNDEEWKRTRDRLIEFASTLTRWDSEQRDRTAPDDSEETKRAS